MLPAKTIMGSVNQTSPDAYLELLKKCLTGYLFPESSNRAVRPHAQMPFLRKMLVKFLAGRGYNLFQVMPFSPENREEGKDWPSIGYTMIGLKRLGNLQYCVETVLNQNVSGDLVETGVWRGGACIFMRAILKARGVSDRKVHVADSFEGLPAPRLEQDKGYDLSEDLYNKVSLEEVQENFMRFDLLDDQVRFHKGWFKDTLPTAPIGNIAVLRMDGDLYESTMDVLNALYDRVAGGGFIIVDDYHGWPPCKKAIHDFRAQFSINDEIHDIDGNGVFWRKSGLSKAMAS